MTDVSIVMVSFNTRELTLQCLRSVYEKTRDIDFEVVLIDNASSDNSFEAVREVYPGVRAIASDVNLGFGRANNLGARQSTGKYLFFLNPDCVLINNAVKAFFEFMETNNPDGSVGAAGGLLYDSKLQISTSFQRFPRLSDTLINLMVWYLNRIFPFSFRERQVRNYKEISEAEEVDFIMGADLFVPRATFEGIMGFDEQFFLYFEETDLQKRMADQGLRRLILSGPRIIHIQGAATRKCGHNTWSKTIFFDSMYKYVKKHHSAFYRFFHYLLVTPLLSVQLLGSYYNRAEKKDYLRVLLRRPLRNPWPERVHETVF